MYRFRTRITSISPLLDRAGGVPKRRQLFSIRLVCQRPAPLCFRVVFIQMRL